MMQRYIDSNDLEKGMYENPSDDFEHGWNEALEGAMLAIKPNPNVVEVVRCEDCKHYYTYYHQCKKFSAIRACDDYCSFGERKEQP